MRPSVQQRFDAKVDKTGPVPVHAPHLGNCWLWTATQVGGYGRFWTGAAFVVAHAYLKGRAPDGLVWDHLCRVRNCVRPDHLEPVTQRVNILRGEGWGAINAAKTHCAQGHPFTEENTYVYRARTYTKRCCRICNLRITHERRKANR